MSTSDNNAAHDLISSEISRDLPQVTQWTFHNMVTHAVQSGGLTDVLEFQEDDGTISYSIPNSPENVALIDQIKSSLAAALNQPHQTLTFNVRLADPALLMAIREAKKRKTVNQERRKSRPDRKDEASTTSNPQKPKGQHLPAKNETNNQGGQQKEASVNDQQEPAA